MPGDRLRQLAVYGASSSGHLENDSAVTVGSVNLDRTCGKPVKNVPRWMAEGIILTYADHRKPRPNRLKPVIGRSRIAAVVPDLKQVTPDIRD